MTTQLIIDGRETVLPQNFAVTVKRENSFFTKSGEYTYDATLRLDNPVNNSLYGFLHRLNKTDEVNTGRSAVLIADGHVYCRGTEVVTGWTEQTVTIQIVSGESELNYFIGQDRKIDELDLGEIDDEDTQVVYPCIRTKTGGYLNVTRKRHIEKRILSDLVIYSYTHQWNKDVAMPFLCVVLDRLLTALGYTVGENQLEGTLFERLFLVNTVRTRKLAKMVPGWTVKDFMEEVEKLAGVVFVTDNQAKTCSIIRTNNYYTTARQLTIRNVVDAYEAEVIDGDGQEAEFSTSNVAYDLPDHHWAKLMRTSEYLPSLVEKSYGSLFQLVAGAWSGTTEEARKADAEKQEILVNTSTGRKYIRVFREEDITIIKNHTLKRHAWSSYIMEINQFADLQREDAESTLELKITPAPMTPFGVSYCGAELINLGDASGYFDYIDFTYEDEDGDEDYAEEEEKNPYGDTVEDTILNADQSESSQEDLYVAFSAGTTYNGFPVVHTDHYHLSSSWLLRGGTWNYSPAEADSLRLSDLETGYFQGGYRIDTSKAVTIETYDPNVIDPRQVYVIRNKRFVCRDVEEVITAEGRQAKWKGTFYPITISDESLERRWVLTHGVWDDHAAWLDDGRWTDDYDGATLE